MFKKILVPLDGAQLSQRTLEPALALGRPIGVELLRGCVLVTDTLSCVVSKAQQRKLARNAHAYLKNLLRFNEQSQLNICAQVPAGNATGTTGNTTQSAARPSAASGKLCNVGHSADAKLNEATHFLRRTPC